MGQATAREGHTDTVPVRQDDSPRGADTRVCRLDNRVETSLRENV